MHLFDASVGFLGGHGIVGGQLPLGAGVAWAIQYRGGDQVCMCFMGDAAVNQQHAEKAGRNLSRVAFIERPRQRLGAHGTHVNGEICTLMEPVALFRAVSNARLTAPRLNRWVMTGSSSAARSASRAVVAW